MAGQTDFFLKIDGIDGESQDDKHKGAGEFPKSPSFAPTYGGGVHQRVDQEEHAARDETSADRVEVT